MSEIRYIHAADLHLDTPFSGLARENANEHIAKMLKDATFTALDRLVRLCENQRPHFLVLAGDTYNRDDASIKAHLKLREACVSLDELGIPVYIAHGNHDPLSSRLQSLKFPANVHVFSADRIETFVFEGPDNARALIHGMSHGQDREGRNLAQMFQKSHGDGAFQLGVLHCAVENSGAADRYAPCSLLDLKQTGLDAWALGHVHERKILSETPFIAYSGNTQGLHINEQGSRGCLLVRARKTADSWYCEPEFHTLGPVQWKKIYLDMEQASDQPELESRLATLIEEVLDEADPAAAALILRLSIGGHTALNSWLRQDRRIEDLQALVSHNSGSHPQLILKDVELSTRDERDWQEYLGREDLLGETMRIYAAYSENPEEFKEVLAKVLEPLSKRPQLSRLLQEADEDELEDLLYQAENICLEVLEGR